MNKLILKKYVRYGLIAIGGIFIGWLLFHTPRKKTEEKLQDNAQNGKATIWTCAMHPHIRMSAPGKCPICGMELISLNQSNIANIDADAIHLSKEAAQLANVLTSLVTSQKPIKEVRLYGKVQADERALQSQVSHLPGRIEKLMLNFTGERVRKGQTLALIYSPELVTAQQELLETAKMKQTQPEIYEAAKDKLRQWMLTDSQIEIMESSGTAQNNFEVVSNTSGIVTARRVNNGDHVAEGTVLYDIADLSHVWVMFDAYESDLPFLEIGNKLTFTVQAIPGSNYSGNIIFIDPVIDPVTRVSKVRVEINNQSGKLKPEMFVTGIVKANLNEYRNKLVIPRTAVLWTGKRSIVYVKQTGTDEPIFKIREIGLGPMLGSSYVVTDGLKEGEEIVTQGTFSVDAAAQLDGKPSMMNPVGGKTSSMPGMDMPGDAQSNSSAKNEQSEPIKSSNSPKIKVDMNFTMQLNTVFDQYIILKNAFVKRDIKETKQAAQKVQQTLAKVDMKLLTGDAHMQWMDILGKMNSQINQMASSRTLEEQRIAFAGFNEQFYNGIKTFGLMGKTVYYQFCPMANKNKGAYWISESKTIRNPYFGAEMMDCGETKETLSY